MPWAAPHAVEQHDHVNSHRRELAEHLELRAGLGVLDVGSGLGGPARHLAQHAGADVTGVDLTEEYVDVARRLTDRVGLADRARFQQGDVTALPFPQASFDRAWMLHVGMNIEDKARLFTEISRVLTDNRLFVVYDVMLLGDPTLVSYPGVALGPRGVTLEEPLTGRGAPAPSGGPADPLL